MVTMFLIWEWVAAAGGDSNYPLSSQMQFALAEKATLPLFGCRHQALLWSSFFSLPFLKILCLNLIVHVSRAIFTANAAITE